MRQAFPIHTIGSYGRFERPPYKAPGFAGGYLLLESLGSVTEGQAKIGDIFPILSGGRDLPIRFAVDDHGWPSHVLNWPTVKEGLQRRYEAAMPKKSACDMAAGDCDTGALAFAFKYSSLAHKLERMDDRGLIGELMPWMFYARELPLDAVPGKPIERKGRFNQRSDLLSLPGEEHGKLTRDGLEIRFNLEQTTQAETAADVIRMMSSVNVVLNGGSVADMPSEHDVQETTRTPP